MVRREKRPEPVTRSGTVAIVGRSNVGKSTLLNAALGEPLAIVSRQPQTTRTPLLGVVRHGAAEIAFLDTPGLHLAKDRLGREMNRSARDAARAADLVVFVVALPKNKKELRPHAGDLALLGELPADKRVVLVVNKVDLVRDKRAMLPLLQALAAERAFAAVVPISALSEDGVSRVLDEIALALPEGPARFAEDEITDKPMRHFAAEYVREAILRATREEVPHAVAVTIDEYIEPGPKQRVTRIAATIHVDRDGQKRILIGEKGAMLKRIGIAARARIEQLAGGQVHLELWVRVTEGWRDKAQTLADFGLRAPNADGGEP